MRFDPGLWLLAAGLLLAAVAVFAASGPVWLLDQWMGKDLMSRGWKPRHRGRPALVAPTQQATPDPDPVPADQTHDIGDGTAYAKELHAIVEQIKAEETGEIAPLPLTGDLPETTIAALQERTAVLPVLDLHYIIAERQTRAEFDELVRCDCVTGAETEPCIRCLERAALNDARTRLGRVVTSPTGEYPLVQRTGRELVGAS